MINIHKYLINLKKNKDRLNSSLNELDKVNLNDFVIRVNAKDHFYAEDNMHTYIRRSAFENIKNPKNTFLYPNFKSVACTISHVNCWKHMIENNFEHAIIMEDDIEITDISEFKFNYNNMISIIEKEFVSPDIGSYKKGLYIIFNGKYLDYHNEDYYHNEYYYHDENSDNSNNRCYSSFDNAKYFDPTKAVIGCHFYYINNVMARFFLEKLKYTTCQIDIEISILSRLSYNKYLFFNIETDSIVQSKKFRSDIQFYRYNKITLARIISLDMDITGLILEYLPTFYKF